MSELENLINLQVINRRLSNYRFNLTNEKVLQAQIEERFKGYVKYRREVRLSPNDIIDFISEDIGIEIKIKGNSKSIYRQLERYCRFDEIKSIILVTNKIMKLPAQINNKNTHIINIAKGWL